MKALAIISNAAFLASTLLVLATEPPTGAVYFLLTASMLLIPAATLVGLFTGASSPRRDFALATCNAALLAAICVAAAQPHSLEPGYVPYVVLAALTPGISALVLLLRGRALARAA
jgi:hypothetical protein